MNPHLAQYAAAPTAKNWTRVLAAAVQFDLTTFHCHAPGALVSVGNLVFQIVTARARGGKVEKRLRRFNRRKRGFNNSTTTAEQVNRYVQSSSYGEQFRARQ